MILMIELNLLNVKTLKLNNYKTMKQTNKKYNIIKYKQLILTLLWYH